MPIRLDLAQSIQPLKVLGLERIALDLAAAGLGVAGVEVQAVRAGQERQRLVQVGPQLVGRAGLAGIVAGDRQAAAELLARVLETADVVPLPAVQRDRDRREPRQGRIDIDAPFRVLLLRTGEGLFRCFRRQRSWRRPQSRRDDQDT